MSDKNRVHPGTAEAPVSALLGTDRKCLTPEAHYETAQQDARSITVTIRFPFDVGFWANGTAYIRETGVSEADGQAAWDRERLRVYDERAAEQKRLCDLIHDQMEVVGADAYRVMRDVDAFLGRDTVEYGIAHARWRREKRGPKPQPAHTNGPTGQDGRSPGSRDEPEGGSQ